MAGKLVFQWIFHRPIKACRAPREADYDFRCVNIALYVRTNVKRTDEPRRSNRATKGQHTKKDDSAEPTPAPPKEKVKSATKTKSKKKQDAAEDEEEGTDVIRCICGATESTDDEPDDAWIGCDNCLVWQHCTCMGISRNSKKQPKKYLCEEHGPQKHPELMEAVKNGETMAQVAERRREAYAKLGDAAFDKPTTKKGGRRSDAAPTPVKEESAAPTPPEKAKTPASDRSQPPPSKRKSSSQVPDAPAGNNKRRKSENKTTAAKVDTSVALVDSLDQLPANRIKIANVLKNGLAHSIPKLLESNQYQLPKSASVDSLAEKLALQIEYSMLMNHTDIKQPDFGGSYKDSFIRITASIKRDETLVLKLLNGTITPDALSTMSADELKDDEQRAKDIADKERLDRQHVLAGHDTGPRMRRTHKGDEMIDDQANQMTSDAISTMAPPLARRRESAMDDQAADSPIEQKTPVIPQGPADAVAQSPTDGADRRSSSNFDIGNVWSSVQAAEGRPMQQPPRRYSSNQMPSQAKHAEDKDVDRLLDDDEDGENEEPYSPSEITGGDVWRGTLSMPGINQFNTLAHHVAGGPLGGRIGVGQIFPKDLQIGGRIPSKDAIQYVSSLYGASNTDVVVFDLVPTNNDNTTMRHFDQLFDYFLSRDRWGVIPENQRRENVRDIYVFPVEKGNAPLPSFFDMLVDNKLSTPETRTKRHLCAVFVLRWKSTATDGVQQAIPSSVLSPVGSTAPPASVLSPSTTGLPERGMPPAQHQQPAGTNGFPNYPYEAPPQSGTPVTIDLINKILGPLVNTPTVQHLLPAVHGTPGFTPEVLNGLAKILTERPDTQQDFEALMKALNGIS